MNKQFKYVTFGALDNSCRQAVLFSTFTNHSEIGNRNTVTTAGFCTIGFTGKRAEDRMTGQILDVIKVHVFGKSVSLGDIAVHEKDCELIAETLGCILYRDDLEFYTNNND